MRLYTKNNSGRLQMENVGGERLAAGEYLKWLASNEKRWWLSTENDGGELQIENYSIEI